MTKTNKTLLTLLFAAVMAICAGFALLLTRPADRASAEETAETPTYSETWIINEKWTVEDRTGIVFYSISSSIGNDETLYNEIDICMYNQDKDFIRVKNTYDGNTSESKELSMHYLKTDLYEYYTGSVDLNDIKEENLITYAEWKDNGGKITFYEDTSAEKFSVLRTWLEANAVKQTAEDPTPTKYTVTFTAGETVLGTVEAEENAKLSALDLSAISTAKEGYTFKGWSLTNGGEVIDLDTVTVTGDVTLYAVYEKNADPSEPTEPADPTDPTEPENPNDPSFEDKIKDFGEKASTWIKDNIGITLSGSAIIIILIVAALVIVFKRK